MAKDEHKDVVPAGDTAVVPLGWENQPKDILKYHHWAMERKNQVLDGDVAGQIAEAIQQAESEEDIYAEGGTVQLDDILGRPFVFGSVEFALSTLKPTPTNPNPIPVYVVLTATMQDTGEEVVITCGGRTVLAQVGRAKEKGFLPSTPVKAISRTTQGGTDVYRLVKA